MPKAGEKLPGPKKKEVSASLVVTLPADATLTFNGQPTKSTSGTRTFVTPPLEPGRDYHYQLQAEIQRDGQRQIVRQQVSVRPGEETRVFLDFNNAQAVSNP